MRAAKARRSMQARRGAAERVASGLETRSPTRRASATFSDPHSRLLIWIRISALLRLRAAIPASPTLASRILWVLMAGAAEELVQGRGIGRLDEAQEHAFR